jgi:hypothetical protein
VIRAVAVLTVGLAAVAVLYVIGWPASPYRDNDFASFWVMGRMLLDGQDMYDFNAYVEAHRAIGSRALTIVVAGTPTFYPLTTALLCAPFAAFPLTIAAPLWLVTQIILGARALFALGRALFPTTLRRDLALLFGMAVAFQPVWLLAAGGNIGGFLLAIVGSSAALLVSGRPYAAGAVAGLLVVKPHLFILAFIVLLLTLPRAALVRFFGAAAAVAGGLTVITLLIRPGWIGELLAELGAITAYASRQATVFGLLGPDNAVVAWTIVAASLIVMVAWARWKKPPAEFILAAAIPLSLFGTRYGWSYDHVLLLVAVAVTLAIISSAGERTRVAMLLAIAIAVVVLPWTTYAIAFQRGDESWSAVVPLAMLLVLAVAARVAPSWMRR